MGIHTPNYLNQRKPGVGSWSFFEDGLTEYKEAQLKADWWYDISPEHPYSTKNEKKRFQNQGSNKEDITPLRKRILNALRHKKDESENKMYKYTWTGEGIIYWRTDAESRMSPQPKPHAVNCPDDLKELGFSEEEIYKIVHNIRD